MQFTLHFLGDGRIRSPFGRRSRGLLVRLLTLVILLHRSNLTRRQWEETIAATVFWNVFSSDSKCFGSPRDHKQDKMLVNWYIAASGREKSQKTTKRRRSHRPQQDDDVAWRNDDDFRPKAEAFRRRAQLCWIDKKDIITFDYFALVVFSVLIYYPNLLPQMARCYF